VAEFIEVITLPRFRLAFQVREKFAACIATGIAPEFLAHEALECADGDRLVDSSSTAGSLTWSAAYAAAQRS
jgi:hypothetical protein